MGHIPDYIYRKWHRIFHEYRKTVNRLSNCKLITLLVRASTIISRNCHGILPGILRHHLLHGDCKSIVRYRAQSFKNLPPPDASRSNSLISFLCFLPSPSSPRDHFIFLSLHQRSRLALSLILSLLLLFSFIFHHFPPSHPISSSPLSSLQDHAADLRIRFLSNPRRFPPSILLRFFLPSFSSRTQKTDMYLRDSALTCPLQGGRYPERKRQQGLRDTGKGRWLSQQLPMV